MHWWCLQAALGMMLLSFIVAGLLNVVAGATLQNKEVKGGIEKPAIDWLREYSDALCFDALGTKLLEAANGYFILAPQLIIIGLLLIVEGFLDIFLTELVAPPTEGAHDSK